MNDCFCTSTHIRIAMMGMDVFKAWKAGVLGSALQVPFSLVLSLFADTDGTGFFILMQS